MGVAILIFALFIMLLTEMMLIHFHGRVFGG